MAVQLDPNCKDDLKTQFVTREGTYRLMTLSEYSRPNRVGYQTNQNNPQVRVSLVSLPINPAPSSIPLQSTHQPAASAAIASNSLITTNGQDSSSGGAAAAGGQQLLSPHTGGGGDRICFNFGKELYVYAYRGCKKISVDLSKPVDKKLYKGTNPSCHDFNETVAMPDGAPLLVGFTTGQIQLVQPGKREPGRLFNEERFIDKTKVTCLKWLPKSPNLFLASHASGHLYLYNEELPCTPSAPNYQPFKSGDGYTIVTCKSKSTRNPLYKWTFGNDPNCCINEFCFSPCGLMLAIVSQDGFLRVFNYDKMELLGVARSYFGGFLCVCWSPDGKYIVVGGEDDLVTVWSLHERRVVARGQGHRSWVSVVAFDPYTSYSHWDGPDFSDDENPISDGFRCYSNASHHTDISDFDDRQSVCGKRRNSTSTQRDSTIVPDKLGTSYRLGSVSQDTQLCLWDITEDVLRQSHDIRQRLSSHDPQVVNGEVTTAAGHVNDISGITVDNSNSNSKNSSNSSNKSVTYKFATANCTSGTSESGRNSINDNTTSKHLNSSLSKTTNSNSVKSNSVNIGNNIIGKGDSSVVPSSNDGSGGGGGSSKPSGSKSSSSGESGLNAFNTITQRLSNFGFGNDKKSDNSGGGHQSGGGTKKTFTFSKSTGNHSGFLHNNIMTTSTGETSSSSASQKNSKTSANSIVPSYDPMQLIGTSLCPRYDECPLLEPLVCKKIAHERLTALIFREDCFLTACQDGYIYTWARPGYANISNLTSSPTGPPGGTVV